MYGSAPRSTRASEGHSRQQMLSICCSIGANEEPVTRQAPRVVSAADLLACVVAGVADLVRGVVTIVGRIHLKSPCVAQTAKGHRRKKI